MCLSPVNIPNQTKYISLRHRDPFLMQVPCGRCAECQTTLSNQWYYRAYYEWLDVIDAKGYVLFDTLTYRNEDLPHLSDFWTLLDKRSDYPCFNPDHIRKFLQVLRVRLIRAGYSKNAFRYFISTEYGTSECGTHRPHIHLMLYVYDRIDVVWLSKLIASIWKFGRTDGVPYQGTRYVLNNRYIPYSGLLANKLRTCRYVTKYVQKSCLFQRELDKRIAVVMRTLSEYADPVSPDSWLESEIAHRERLKLLRFVNQFHRQSQHFGESALRDIDLNQLVKDGCLFMPDSERVKIAIPLPTYYKRKLFQELVEFNGSRYWQYTDDGLSYISERSKYSYERLVDKYSCIVRQYSLPVRNVSALADYVMNVRGSIRGDLGRSTLEQRIPFISLYNYSTCSDKLQFGCRGLSSVWHGDSQTGYLSCRLSERIPLSSFIQKYCYFDEEFEKELDSIFAVMNDFNSKKQKVFETKQRLKYVYANL